MPEDYHGGATFWSPKKVEEACDRQAQQDADKLLQQQQKEEEIQQRQIRKEAKAVMLEQRHQEASTAKQRRLELKEEKAAQREENWIARAADRQLKKDIKMAKKGKMPVQEPTLPPIGSAAGQAAGVDKQDAVEVTSVALPKATRTRKVQLPERYLA
ncbi:hypothetical protein EJ04DRAFT_58533 [Polyplosphaeria fusca]|uniref:Uncharacterized protein n=1 Tax=Polyplosphaeria fusca TaxID=682080 RepID=A0A9P4QQI4_9PLEO|nr:hypothetical protein EJ04DRAFT_58533 [Polyplosphaeria fusca]